MKIALAYSSSDDLIAKRMEEKLTYDKWEFVHFVCTKDAKDRQCLVAELRNFNGPILLLVSDFLLKQTNCLEQVLDFFSTQQEDVLPVLLPLEDGADLKLEKIGDIIQYINYWQDKYLSFRNQRREMHLENDAAFEKHLDTVRSISKEVGEFLRYFRDGAYPTLAAFEKDNFKVFFDFLEAPAEWEAFAAQSDAGHAAPSKNLEASVDNVSNAEESSGDEAFLEEELADIPGISLLGDKEGEKEEEIPLSEADLLLSKIAADPKNSSHYYNYAVYCQEKAADVFEAEKYFETALEVDSRHPFAWYRLAKIYLSRQEVSQAQSAYQKAIYNNTDIQTRENDRLFGVEEQQAETTDAESPYDVALNALKANIDKLSSLIKIKNEENKRLEAERLKSLEKEKVGKGKQVLITGVTSGIGKATALKFAENGFNLIITGRRKERLEAVANKLRDTFGVEVKSLVFDVSNAAATKKALGALRGKWRNIDVLINNAGKAKGLAPIQEGEIAHWDEMIDTNIKGLLYVTRMVSPWMVERKEGMIINLCSSAGKEVYPNGNVYCGTKFAVDALTKSMRLDLHSHNIRVGQVSPGHVEETEFAEVRFDGDKEKAKIYEKFRPLTSGDVADAIYYMATRPAHVNIEDVVMFGTQQASNLICDRSGRGEKDKE